MPRLLRCALGWLLLVPGFLVFITPVPGGILMMTAGFFLLYSASHSFRQRVFKLIQRFPKTTMKLRRYFDFDAAFSDCRKPSDAERAGGNEPR